MTSAGGRAIVIALLVVSVAITGGFATAGSATAADDSGVHRVVAQQNDTPDERNETPPHRNPDEYSEDGNLEGVEGWLVDRMTSQLGEGAIQLSEGEYDLASDYVGEEYRERLEQYVDVAGQTGGESLENDFEQAGQQQARLTEAVREYRETKTQYEAAREAGDDERARELARELERLANEIQSLGGSVRERYDEIESETGANLSEPDAAVENVTDEIRAEQATVREQEFEETTLTLTPESETISFLDPLVATGELRTAGGIPIANEEIRLEIGNRTERVTTDSTGEFTLEYRPTDEPVSTDQLTVEYVPDSGSIYLGNETNVSVSIEQVEPTVSLSETPSELSYGGGDAVTGELRVDGVAVDGVPLAVTVDGQRVGTATARNGMFGTSVSLPASVDDGQRELAVRLPFEDRALAATATATTVTVRETESTLSIDAASAGNRSIAVNGTLETAGGDGVGGEPVQFSIDGTTVGTVTTGANGTFEETLSVPGSVDGGEVTVTATYEASGSNLEPTTADAVVTIGDATAQLPSAVWLGAGFLALIALAAGVWWYRRAADGESAPAPASDRESGANGTSTADRAAEPSTAAVDSLLERASDQLANGRPDDAARTGYAAVRRALAARFDGGGALTHWEFYRRIRGDDETTAELLYDVTQGYERAAFDRGDVSPDDAANVLETARRLCRLDDPSDDGSPADD